MANLWARWQGLDARIRAYLVLLTLIEIPFLLPWLSHADLARYAAAVMSSQVVYEGQGLSLGRSQAAGKS